MGLFPVNVLVRDPFGTTLSLDWNLSGASALLYLLPYPILLHPFPQYHLRNFARSFLTQAHSLAAKLTGKETRVDKRQHQFSQDGI
jgi:hypothetical protein